MEFASSKQRLTNSCAKYSPYRLILCCQSAVLSCCLLISANSVFPVFVVALSLLVFTLFFHSHITQSRFTFNIGEVLLYCLLFLLYPGLKALHTLPFYIIYGLIFIGFVTLCHKVVTIEHFKEQS